MCRALMCSSYQILALMRAVLLLVGEHYAPERTSTYCSYYMQHNEVPLSSCLGLHNAMNCLATVLNIDTNDVLRPACVPATEYWP
jgi:hypothetical protein